MIEDQTTRQGAGHAWGKNCSKRKSINRQLCIGAGRSTNDHSSCRFVYTQKFSLPTLCSTLKTRLFSKKESLLIAFQIINSFGNMGHSTYLITRCSRGIYWPWRWETSWRPCATLLRRILLSKPFSLALGHRPDTNLRWSFPRCGAKEGIRCERKKTIEPVGNPSSP